MQTRPKSREQGWFQLLPLGRSPPLPPPPRPPLGPTTPAWPSTWGSSWQRPRCGQTCLSTYLQLFRWPNHFWGFFTVKFAKMTFVINNNFMKQSSSIATVPGSGMVAPISGLSTGLAKAQVWINTIFNRHKSMMLLLTLLSDKSFFSSGTTIFFRGTVCFSGKPWGETNYPLQRRWWQNWSPGEGSQQRSIFYCFGEASLNKKFFCAGVFVCLVTKGSPAALGGLRFGDQILQVDGVNLAGFSSDKVCPSGGPCDCDVTRLHILRCMTWWKRRPWTT